MRIVTHERVFDPPTDLDRAIDDLESGLGPPSLVMLGESPAHAAHLRRMVEEGRTTGNLVHDAHIAALAVEHGVSEVWTLDRDFARFPGIKLRNPLISPP